MLHSFDVYLLYKKTNIDEASKLNRILFKSLGRREISRDYDKLFIYHLDRDEINVEVLDFYKIMLSDYLIEINDMESIDDYSLQILTEKDNYDSVCYILENNPYWLEFYPEDYIINFLNSECDKIYFKLLVDKMREIIPSEISEIYNTYLINIPYNGIINSIETGQVTGSYFFIPRNITKNLMEKIGYVIELYGSEEAKETHNYIVDYYDQPINLDSDILSYEYFSDVHIILLFLIKCEYGDTESLDILYDRFKETFDKYGRDLMDYAFYSCCYNKKFQNIKWLILKSDELVFGSQTLKNIKVCEIMFTLVDKNKAHETLDSYIADIFCSKDTDKKFSEWLWNHDTNNLLKDPTVYNNKFLQAKDEETLEWILEKIEDKNIIFSNALHKISNPIARRYILLNYDIEDDIKDRKFLFNIFDRYIHNITKNEATCDINILNKIYEKHYKKLNEYFSSFDTVKNTKLILGMGNNEFSEWYISKICYNKGINYGHVSFLKNIRYNIYNTYYGFIEDRYLDNDEIETKYKIIKSTKIIENFLYYNYFKPSGMFYKKQESKI